MEKKKSKSKWFFRILGVLFIIYASLLIAFYSGYYETKMSKRTTLTNEAMKQFEEDVKQGKQIDINNYLEHDDKDYSNLITKVGNKVSNGVSSIMTNGISGIFNSLKGLFW